MVGGALYFAEGREAVREFIHARMRRGPERDAMSALRQRSAEVQQVKFTTAPRSGTAAHQQNLHPRNAIRRSTRVRFSAPIADFRPVAFVCEAARHCVTVTVLR